MTLQLKPGHNLNDEEVARLEALLALVMLGLLTAMRSFAQSETRIDERIRLQGCPRSQIGYSK